jgi:hypothetical protein
MMLLRKWRTETNVRPGLLLTGATIMNHLTETTAIALILSLSVLSNV